MSNKLKTLTIIAFLCFLLLTNPAKPVIAQLPTPSAGITISPSIIIIDDQDRGKVQEIKVTNNTDEDFSFEVSETTVIKSDQGKILPVNKKITEPMLDLNQNLLTVPKHSEAILKVRVKISAKAEGEAYPGVMLTRNNTNEANKTATVIINSFVIGVILQNYESELKADNDLRIDYSILSFNSNFKVLGELNNTGGKFFDPNGSIIIYKEGVKIYEKQITSQIQGLIFPNEKKSYLVDWLNNLNILKKIGNYTVESRVNVASIDKSFVSKVQFFYLPIDIFLIFLAIVLALLFLLIFLGKKIRKKRAINLT